MFYRALPCKKVVAVLAFSAGFGWCAPVLAGLFDDEEARKAILELRQRVEANRLDTDQKLQALDLKGAEQTRRVLADEVAPLRKGILDLQGQIDLLKADISSLRGQNELLARENQSLVRQLTDLQRQQRDALTSVDERLRRSEPVKVTVDGREFMAEPAEKRDYEGALATFRKGDFPLAQTQFQEFVRRFGQSGYIATALFWLGNAQYANRDYAGSMANFRLLLSSAPDHLRAPEAVLSIANCQVELKDTRGARKTLEDLIKAYPQSEAAVAAKERLARLR